MVEINIIEVLYGYVAYLFTQTLYLKNYLTHNCQLLHFPITYQSYKAIFYIPNTFSYCLQMCIEGNNAKLLFHLIIDKYQQRTADYIMF